MTARARLERFVKRTYPDAVFDCYCYSAFGHELQFYPSEISDELMSCVLLDGRPVIVTDF